MNENERGYRIIAVDFDGTICFSNWPECGEPNIPIIDYLKKRKKEGDKLILWTCREGKELMKAVEWSEKQGLVFDTVNDNVPEQILRYGCNSRKISCDVYIDDRAVKSISNFDCICKENANEQSIFYR